jgi:hypothetical protein
MRGNVGSWHLSDMGHVRLESIMRAKADVRRPLPVYGFTP